MNVAFDPWIPVVDSTGQPRKATLREMFTEGDSINDLAVRPHERVALMRLFLCVAHAALDGPRNYDEWQEIPKRLPSAADGYLAKWKDSFELFHPERPWLQTVELRKTKDGPSDGSDVDEWTPVSKLCFTYATGISPTLHDHLGTAKQRPIPIEETVRSMLAFQCFSPGGLITQVYWGGEQTAKSSKDGPCIPGSMTHSFLRGDCILQSICLNLPTYDDIRENYGGIPVGVPVWEASPCFPSDSSQIQNATQTYLGRLVPVKRVVKLHPSGCSMLLGEGPDYPTFLDGFVPEPSATVILQQEGIQVQRALLAHRLDKALWRELGALVVKRKTDGTGGALSLRSIQDADDCDLIVLAVARKKATILDTIEAVYHIPGRLRAPDGNAAYEAEVAAASALARKLGWAIETYRAEIDGGWESRLRGAGPSKGELKAKLYRSANTYFWTRAEVNLPFLIAHIAALDTDNAIPTRKAWRKMLFSTACDSYRIACGRDTPRHLRAFAKGWGVLTRKTLIEDSHILQVKEEKA